MKKYELLSISRFAADIDAAMEIALSLWNDFVEGSDKSVENIEICNLFIKAAEHTDELQKMMSHTEAAKVYFAAKDDYKTAKSTLNLEGLMRWKNLISVENVADAKAELQRLDDDCMVCISEDIASILYYQINRSMPSSNRVELADAINLLTIRPTEDNDAVVKCAF